MKNILLSCMILIAALASSSPALVQGTVWVANENGNSLTVINTATNEVVTTLQGIGMPHNVQVAPDGKSVWVTSMHHGQVVKIDPITYRVVGTAKTGKSPAHVIVTPDSKKVYVANEDDNTVSVIDASTLKTITTIPVGHHPHGLRTSPDGKLVCVANMESGSVSLIDTTTDKKIADIAVGKGPVQVAFSPSGKILYVSLSKQNAIAKIDLTTKKVTAEAAVGDGPIQLFATRDDQYVLVANQGTKERPANTLSFVYTRTFKTVDDIVTGRGVHGVVVDDSGKYAYVTNTFDDSVGVVEIAARKLVATVRVGQKPNGISYSPQAPPPEPASNTNAST